MSKADTAIKILNNWEESEDENASPINLLFEADLHFTYTEINLHEGKPDIHPVIVRTLAFDDGSRTVQFSENTHEDHLRGPWVAVAAGSPSRLMRPAFNQEQRRAVRAATPGM